MMYLHSFRMLYEHSTSFLLHYMPWSRTHMQVPSAHSVLISDTRYLTLSTNNIVVQIKHRH